MVVWQHKKRLLKIERALPILKMSKRAFRAQWNYLATLPWDTQGLGRNLDANEAIRCREAWKQLRVSSDDSFFASVSRLAVATGFVGKEQTSEGPGSC